MKLFVAKLNRDAVESDLLEWFGAMGPVRSAKIVMDRDTGQSKCFGFVEMESREGGEKAISEMNGKEFMGFRMVVKEAEEREIVRGQVEVRPVPTAVGEHRFPVARGLRPEDLDPVVRPEEEALGRTRSRATKRKKCNARSRTNIRMDHVRPR